jgi:hypothetical protein
MTESSAAQDPMVGTTIEGKYEILRRIGEGGMGSVYEVRHLLLGRKLAVKVLLPEVAGDPDVVRRFHNEARIAASLGHENVIEITDMGVLPTGAPFIVMEYLQGESLAHRLEESGRLAADEAVRILVPVLDALAVVHEAGVVHRDLKPDNVFLARRSGAGGTSKIVVKLLDFGISKLRAPEAGGFHLTRTGTVLGTPYYMSPEQASGAKDLDHRADLYAVGVMLYEMLVGRRPFEGDTYNALLAAILTRDPVPACEACPDIPRELDAVIRRAMARVPEQRYGSAAEFLQALAPFAPPDAQPRIAASRLPPLPAKSAVGTPAAREVPATGWRRAGGTVAAWIGAVVLVAAGMAFLIFRMQLWPRDEAVAPAPPSVPALPVAEAPRPPPAPVPRLPDPPPVATASDAGASSSADVAPEAATTALVATAPSDAGPVPSEPDAAEATPEPPDAQRRPAADARRTADRAVERPAQDASPLPGQPARPDAAIARGRFEAVRNDVRGCFGAGAGRVTCTVDFSGGTGRMLTATVSSQPARPGVAPCVREVLRRVQMPPFAASSTTVVHVYELGGSASPSADAGTGEVIRTVIEEYDEPPRP